MTSLEASLEAVVEQVGLTFLEAEAESVVTALKKEIISTTV